MDEPINPKYKEFTEFFFRADASRKYLNLKVRLLNFVDIK